MMDDLAFLSATEQLSAFRSGEISPAEVLEAQFELINADRDRGVERINALTETMETEAYAEAARNTEAYAKARRANEVQQLPALLGISVVAKEKHGLAGHSLSMGLLSQKQSVAEVDHPIIERLRTAGAIIHGRATSPEFSCATVTHSPIWGVTRNPWNPQMSPGGSSGGSGAALAAGFTTLATASDIAGSTRIPAAFTGTVGYKAPYGRIPGAGELAADRYRGDGPMGRTVADVLLMSSIISGTHPADSNSWGSTNPSQEFEEASLADLKIGVSLELGNYPVSQMVAAAFASTIQRLRDLGANIVEVDLPWTTDQVRETSFAHFGQILAPAMTQIIGNSKNPRAAYTDQFIADALAQAESVSLVDSLRLDALFNQQLNTAMSGVDVLLCPTNAVDWLQADGDYLDGISVAGRKLKHYWEGHMTSPFNIANHRPVMNLPCGVGEANVPIGLQIVGQPWDERTVFQAALAMERVIQFTSGNPYPALAGTPTG
ncbi:amidase [Glutamicibacter sp. NPDC090743]|uniref:amidase n=1 Tax=Glutamicibacter sp. NPDC090743 TaxID=3364001 RepID=UPI00381844B3